jgi:hypothetical protein
MRGPLVFTTENTECTEIDFCISNSVSSVFSVVNTIVLIPTVPC